MRQQIFSAIDEERDLQDSRFGPAFDDLNNPYNWAAYIAQYSTRNLLGNPEMVQEVTFRADMVKVAALAVAAIESIDRKQNAEQV